MSTIDGGSITVGTATTGTVSTGDEVRYLIGSGDYLIYVSGADSSGGTLADPSVRVTTYSYYQMPVGYDNNSGVGNDAAYRQTGLGGGDQYYVYVGPNGAGSGSYTLYVAPYSDSYWSAAGYSKPTGISNNQPPVVTVKATANLQVNQQITLNQLLSVSDANGDAIQKIKIVEPSGVGYVSWADGDNNVTWDSASRTLTLSAPDTLSALTYTGSAAGSEKLTVSAYDGISWGASVDLTATVTNQGAGTPNLYIAASAASKAEGDSGTTPFTFTVVRTGNTSAASSVNYAVTGSGTNAANAADFGGTLPSGTISFAAAETSKTVTVNVSGDTTVESDETFTVTLSNPSNAVLATSTATGTIQNDDKASAIDPTRRLSITSSGASRDVQMDAYTGPVSGLQNQFIGSDASEAARGTDSGDFINMLAGDDAVDGGAGNDVLDGGLGSNFLTGGSGNDTFFVDGRSGGTTWSTVTDLEKGELATAWGWNAGVSKLTWAEMAGADGYKGATAHIDLDNNGSIDMSMTIVGKGSGSIVTTTGSSGGYGYMAFLLS